MTTYYIDPVNGLDTNNGRGADASSATNKPWKTLGKALGASGIASGDTVYLAPGTYRETVSVSVAPTAETKIIGDPKNNKQFKTSDGVLVSPAPVVMSAYTTNDTTAASSTTLLSLNAKDYLTFQYIEFVGGAGNATVIDAPAGSENIKILDCVINGLSSVSKGIVFAGTAGTASAWTVQRCKIVTLGIPIQVTIPTHSASYDINFNIKDSTIIGLDSTGINILGSGATTGAGGVKINACTIFGGYSYGVRASSTLTTTTNPSTVENCLIISTGIGLSAGSSGNITENYNIIKAGTARASVTAGANSQTAYAPLLNIGQEYITGELLKPFLSPKKNSPVLGFTSGTVSSTDVHGGPRPAGGISALYAAGSMERANSASAEYGVVPEGVAASIKITGPGYQDYIVPVEPEATQISVYVRRDTTYAGTYPKIQVLNCEDLGVTSQTATSVGVVSQWEILSLSPFTPTSSGWVVVRLISSDTNGAGNVYFANLNTDVNN